MCSTVSNSKSLFQSLAKKDDDGAVSKLRYDQAEGRNKGLSYEKNDGDLLPLKCPGSRIDLADIRGYTDIWNASFEQDFEYEQFGVLKGEGETRRAVHTALDPFKQSFKKSIYDQCINWLLLKPMDAGDASDTIDDPMGEMFFQQLIYSVFSGVLFSVCTGDKRTYKADQFVKSSLLCKFRGPNGAWEVGRFEIKPDAAGTLWKRLDAFVMMELKQPTPKSPAAQLDEERCIALLCSTLIALDNFSIDTSKLHLPFIIGHGFAADLYIVSFGSFGNDENSQEKIPLVSKVGGSYNLTGHEDRAKMFVALSVLLHNIKAILLENKEAMKQYENWCQNMSQDQTKYPNPFTSRSKNNKRTAQKSDASTSKKPRSSNTDEMKAKEDLAAQAARCDGLFYDIGLLWARPVSMGDDVTVEYQGSSPYYFLGMCASNGRKCFLKIWREDEEGFHDVRTETRFLKQAQNHNVAVAKMITDEAVSVSVNGIMFAVLPTEYIKSSLVSSVDDLFDFSLSLMDVVNSLHEKAGVLHCDIKPNNLRWDSSRRQVYLIDFGHAQLSEGAQHYHATKDFEAPEIREKSLPHSRETDTYSVGATILWTWNDYRGRVSRREDDLDSRMKELRRVGELLSAPLQERLSLNDAKSALYMRLEECKNGYEPFCSLGKRPHSAGSLHTVASYNF